MLFTLLLVACSDYTINPVNEDAVQPEIFLDTGAPFVDEEPEEAAPVEEEELEEPLDCSNGIRQLVTETLYFPARQDCPWSQGDNLAPRENHNQARFTERELIDLPSYTDLCSLTIASQANNLEFDDHFTLTLEDWILVGGGSGYNLDLFDSVEQAYRFDWERLRGQQFADRNAPYVCLGEPESRCIVPPTEQRGPFDVSFSDTALGPIADALDGEAGLEIALHTFGDNDGGDCAHSDITFEIEIEFVLR